MLQLLIFHLSAMHELLTEVSVYKGISYPELWHGGLLSKLGKLGEDRLRAMLKEKDITSLENGYKHYIGNMAEGIRDEWKRLSEKGLPDMPPSIEVVNASLNRVRSLRTIPVLMLEEIEEEGRRWVEVGAALQEVCNRFPSPTFCYAISAIYSIQPMLVMYFILLTRFICSTRLLDGSMQGMQALPPMPVIRGSSLK